MGSPRAIDPERLALLRRQLLAERKRTDALLAELDATEVANDVRPKPGLVIPTHDVAVARARQIIKRNGWAPPTKRKA